MAGPDEATVEFYGVPRSRAGRAALAVPANGSMAAALAVVERTCPGLTGLVRDGQLAPHYLLSLDGRRFVTDLDQPVRPGDRLLLLSADAGG